jgi:hypothetical protein
LLCFIAELHTEGSKARSKTPCFVLSPPACAAAKQKTKQGVFATLAALAKLGRQAKGDKKPSLLASQQSRDAKQKNKQGRQAIKQSKVGKRSAACLARLLLAALAKLGRHAILRLAAPAKSFCFFATLAFTPMRSKQRCEAKK